MQDKFVLKSVKTFKRVAALGTGLVMLGATLTGALAADLKDYPAPFVTAGAYDDANAFVTGDSAMAADTLGLVDISTNLQYMAKTPVASTSKTVTTSGPAKSMQVALSRGLSNTTYFDPSLQDDDISSLFDGEITFKGTAYDTSEELQFGDTNRLEPYVATSLLSDDDYKSNVFMELSRDMVRYAYKFDEDITLSNVTTTDTLNINFMGIPMKLTSVSATQFDAYVGEEHYMNTGDTVTVGGKNIKLIDVGTASVVIEVDGSSKIVTTSSPQTVNGVEVSVDAVFSRTERAESSANLVLGTQSKETYKDGDAFVGEDKDDPNWVWDVQAMLTPTGGSAYTETPQGGASAAVKVLRVENDFTWNDDSDKPAGVGSCINLPNDFLSICLDSINVADSDHKEFAFELDKAADFSDTFGSSYSKVNAIHLSTPVDEGLELPAYTAGTSVNNETSTVKAKDVWFFVNGTGRSISNAAVASAGAVFVDVLYKDTSTNKIKYHGAVNTSTDILAAVNYENTKGTGAQGNIRIIRFDSSNSSGTAGRVTIELDVNGDAVADLDAEGDDLFMNWSYTSDRVSSLGDTASTEEAGEFTWGASKTAIGTKDEDHRTRYGIVVKNPKSESSSDRVKLLVPNDQVFANIVVKGKAATVSQGGASYVPTKVTPRTMLASEVSDPTKYNLIVVGGPCANSLAKTVFDVTCDGWSYKEGEALVKVAANGQKVAMLVAGTTALDTRRAAKAVANYATYALSGTEVVVKGTTLEDISVVKA